MKVLVTGATGTVGAYVIRCLRDRGVPTRAFVRDPGEAARRLGPDVELAVGDFAHRRSLEFAMQDIDRVFLACGNVPGQVELEKAVIDEARAGGVDRIVKLSGPEADPNSALLFYRWHAEIEAHLRAAGLPWVVLRPRTYMTNLLAYAQPVAVTGQLFAPAGAATISFVDPQDVADVAATTLVEDGHAGRTYTVTGPEAVTFDQIAQALSAATGRDIGYVNVPDDMARSALLDTGLPGFMADFVVGVFASQRAGQMASVTGTVRDLLGREARSIAEFARDHATLFAPRPVASTRR